ncbi:leucine-rich repeat-containing protein 59 [Homalodisca vitripennis]|nr:leucine-rich repeat-containing protein 59 [Homalodisca vitripennis]
MAPKKNLMEHYEDGTLDLSLSSIQDIPVRDIAAIPKAINLDLSCNTIVTIPKSFASSLTRLVKLDLSKNQITALPDNFGLLVNLKHLDLDNNRLESLPLSFGNLRSLRWLDLKCNPLMPRLAQIAGLCLDAKQCQAAARNVVAALRTTQEQVEAEISRLKEEQLKKEQLIEENSKRESKENQPSKKKKKKNNAANKISNSELSNGLTHVADEVKNGNSVQEGTSCKVPPVPNKKNAQKQGILRKVGRLIGTLTKFLVMSSLIVVLCGFLLSLLDEDLYMVLRKKVTDWIQKNVPRHYLRHWDHGILVTKRAMENWSGQLIAICVYGFGRLQEYYGIISSDETVQQYLESIKSGWHITWIWLSETYASLPVYFNSVKQYIIELSGNKS